MKSPGGTIYFSQPVATDPFKFRSYLPTTHKSLLTYTMDPSRKNFLLKKKLQTLLPLKSLPSLHVICAYMLICTLYLFYLFFYQGVIGAGHFCSERGFSSVVQELATKLVPCTRRLWQLTKVFRFVMSYGLYVVQAIRDILYKKKRHSCLHYVMKIRN